MAAKVEFPFTSAQWKELERQAMIYKYMMASIPVPPDLLLPLPINFSAHPHASGGYLYNWRCANGKDLEPGRCKRTDGKKWRCAREVAPNQKYCERHMHRGRPRSRKPVEVHASPDNNNNNNKKKSRQLNNNNPPPVSRTGTATVVADNTTAQPNTSSSSHQILGTNLLFPETDTDLSIKAYNNRHIEWVLEDKMDGGHGVQQQWSHLMETKIGSASSANSIYDSNSSLFPQDYEGDEQLNLFPYTDLAASEGVHHSDESQFFFNSDLVSLSKHHPIDQPRGFIDAWSNDSFKTASTNTNDSSVSLTLSMDMAAGNVMDEEMAKIQEGGCDHKPKYSNWVSGATWVPFARGGPLAEVLRTGSITATSDPTSPFHGGYGNSISPPTTTVSSPSGVLQRAFFSPSDSSVCNSPIVSASVAHREGVAYQWLN